MVKYLLILYIIETHAGDFQKKEVVEHYQIFESYSECVEAGRIIARDRGVLFKCGNIEYEHESFRI